MIRSSFSLLKHAVKSNIVRSNTVVSLSPRKLRFIEPNTRFFSVGGKGGEGELGLGLGLGKGAHKGKDDDCDDDNITFSEAKKLMRLVNVEALKMRLSGEGTETVCYKKMLEVCESMGVTKSVEEAKEFVRVLDEAGVVLVFRDKVYLHPDKVVDLVRRAVPLALTPEDDPRREELRVLQEKQLEIDTLAHKQVRCILWTGLAFSLAQIGLFFRLTFWEFSWDVMEPIAFFATTSSLIVGYAYFLFTSRDPTYQDLMKRLFLSRRRKLIKKHNFNFERFMELQKKCKSPLDAHPSAKHHIAGVELETRDLLHRH
ncbi:hypothetical protein CTI12_AA557480 [Artemisia annua]|uniref:Calcium uniporter protein C-terminal domain-containing protein n=1 Tax=Artemisia annua TaxID=35608 RepID=A0A2U1KW56_ARTAN|nr:hypothetical protein CTI12_AA557480 [Artemisia annua]